MTTYPTLTCVSRTEIGSQAARKMLRQGQIPATVYSNGDPVSLMMDRRHFASVERAGQSGSQIVRLTLDGADAGLVLVKAIQRDLLKHFPTHIDLQRISLQQYLEVNVPVHLEGEPAGVHEGGVFEVTLHALNLRCMASAVPESLTHDISTMQVGDTLTAGQIVLPEGCELSDRPEECLAIIRQKLGVAAAPEAAPATA
ncbi:MAG TPA: 50S ribosomal protein L25 [Armatimonadota bacterium]|jgi:large subunit ribosomal protein L25